MQINGLGSTATRQRYETPAERGSGQSIRQQAPPQAAASEERVRSASMRPAETVPKTEGMESKTIDLYA